MPYIDPGSFRDKDGFVFYHNQKVYRAITESYVPLWNKLINEVFFKDLLHQNRLIHFKDSHEPFELPEDIRQVIEVETVPFISYPSEWTFSQLKKAALLTLEIQKKALENNYSLKDASSYNVQFIGLKPVFIDLFSFEAYRENEPWHAYKQFCQHFLGPLLLTYYGHQRLQSLFLNNIDGLPLDLVSKILPFRSHFNLLANTHIHLHARFENKHAEDQTVDSKKLQLSKNRQMALLEHLSSGIKGLKVKSKKTNWTGYYQNFSYSEKGYTDKKGFIDKQMQSIKGHLCVDLGANTGEFSEMASKHFDYVLACDNDLEVVKGIQTKKITNLLALHVDLINPTPAIGWRNEERYSFIDRIQKADLTLALALIHHLCIGNNISLEKLADFFAIASKRLIIEFVPKDDIQVKKLLVTKRDVFNTYNLETFKQKFEAHFQIIDSLNIQDSGRVLFFLQKK